MACAACAPCEVCVTDPTACARGDLFQTCGWTARRGAGRRFADLCGSDKCAVTCATVCLPCADDPSKCFPAMRDQPAGELYESCAGCTDCERCQDCLTDPMKCAPENPGGSLGYCGQCVGRDSPADPSGCACTMTCWDGAEPVYTPDERDCCREGKTPVTLSSATQTA